MTNEKIYEIIDRLGMIESCGEWDVGAAERFERETSKDLVSVINFVNDLTTYNSIDVIRNLLVVIIMENN